MAVNYIQIDFLINDVSGPSDCVVSAVLVTPDESQEGVYDRACTAQYGTDTMLKDIEAYADIVAGVGSVTVPDTENMIGDVYYMVTIGRSKFIVKVPADTSPVNFLDLSPVKVVQKSLQYA
jgi:hypothetical protein